MLTGHQAAGSTDLGGSASALAINRKGTGDVPLPGIERVVQPLAKSLYRLPRPGYHTINSRLCLR